MQWIWLSYFPWSSVEAVVGRDFKLLVAAAVDVSGWSLSQSERHGVAVVLVEYRWSRARAQVVSQQGLAWALATELSQSALKWLSL